MIGGPAYWIGDIAYHLPGGSTRLTNGSAGVLFYHNTILSETAAAGTANVHWRNNLILGENSAPAIFSVNTFTSYTSSDYNGFRPNPGAAVSFQWNAPKAGVRADYTDPTRRAELDARQFRTLDEYRYATGQDQHSVLVDYDVFVNVPKLDAQDIAFASDRADKSTFNLYWQGADGTGEAQRLTKSKNHQYPASWHPSGRFLAFEEQAPQTNGDVMILPMEGDDASGWKPGKATVFLNSPFAEGQPMFSPDGRWLAYYSNETGRFEVYVQSFPGPGGKWQISTGGGVFPTWSRTKRELFYGLNGQIMVAPFAVQGDVFRAEKPRLWSDGRYAMRGISRMFDLNPDGERFALSSASQTPPGVKLDKVVFIFNFFDELRQIAPVKK